MLVQLWAWVEARQVAGEVSAFDEWVRVGGRLCYRAREIADALQVRPIDAEHLRDRWGMIGSFGEIRKCCNDNAW